MHQHLWRGTTWDCSVTGGGGLCRSFGDENALISTFLFYTSECPLTSAINSRVRGRLLDYRHIWPWIWHLLNNFKGLAITQFRHVFMFAARNRVKLPGGCVNGLCQVHYRSRLDIIDLEMAMLGISRGAWENKQTTLFQKEMDRECVGNRHRKCVAVAVAEVYILWVEDRESLWKSTLKYWFSSDYLWMTTLLCLLTLPLHSADRNFYTWQCVVVSPVFSPLSLLCFLAPQVPRHHALLQANYLCRSGRRWGEIPKQKRQLSLRLSKLL